MPNPTGFPTTIPDMKAALGRLLTRESQDRAARYVARPDDVFIATYPKSGTTWMQQIVHGLRTGGSMDFAEISEAVPWLEACADCGQDPHAPQSGGFRAFKTHFPYDTLPKGGRTIYIVRDPRDVLRSFYSFFEGFMFAPGSISLEDFTRDFFVSGSKSGRYWDHVRSYWPHHGDPSVLMLSFEAMKADLPGTVARLARFLGLPHDPARLDVATRQAAYGFMRDHARRFDDHFFIDARRAAVGLPPEAGTDKVSDASDRHALSPALTALLDTLWAQELAPLGFPDYAALRAAVDALPEPAAP